MDRYHQVNHRRNLSVISEKKREWNMVRTISVLADTMRGRIGNEDDHLARRWPPFHVQRLSKGSSDSLRPIPTSTSIQCGKMPLDLADIGRKAKILGDVRVVLGWMIAEGDQADAQVLWGLEAA
jgi:hypothetical protein